MKKQFYAAAIAALAFAACTSEEEMVVSQPQTSPVSFSYVVDDETRATWGGDKGYTLNFTDNDLLSLFHGAEVDEDGCVTAAQNAIYKANGGADGKLNFTTQSMVVKGSAIMVYPADICFDLDTNKKLQVIIPTEQNSKEGDGASLLASLPFISEKIEIKDHDHDEKNGVAGYAKNYVLAMKQVGSVFTLKSNYTGEAKNKIDALVKDGKIAPLALTDVALNRPTDKFNTRLNVKVDGEKRDWNDEKVAGHNWTNMAYVNTINVPDNDKVTTLKSSATIKTNTSNLDACEFILLPQLGAASVKNEQSTTLADNKQAAKNDAFVTVTTNYGFVKITSGNVMFKDVDDKDDEKRETVAEGLEEVIFYTTAPRKSGIFEGEIAGAHITRSIDVDLTELDMSDLHIKDDKHLSDVLTVFNEIKNRAEKLTLIIDGDENGEFALSMKNVARLNTEEKFANIKLKPCTDNGEKCKTVVLTQDADNTEEEIPNIQFISKTKVDVVLSENANWTWTGGAKMFGLNVENLVNKGTVTIKAEATVADEGTGASVPVVNRGTINIPVGTVKMQTALNNYGKVVIDAGAELRANGNATVITNEAVSATEGGVIENSGVLGTTNNGTINNYGTIQNMVGGTANMTYITANQTTEVDFGVAWDATTNKYGTIILKDANDNVSVSNSTSTGFIKYTYTEAVYKTPEVCKYNYVIVEGDIEFTEKETEIKFLEVAPEEGTTAVITNSGNEKHLDLSGFILKGKANVKEGNKVVAPAAYIKGTIYVGGLFCKPGERDEFPERTTTYYGASDADCIVEY